MSFTAFILFVNHCYFHYLLRYLNYKQEVFVSVQSVASDNNTKGLIACHSEIEQVKRSQWVIRYAWEWAVYLIPHTQVTHTGETREMS